MIRPYSLLAIPFALALVAAPGLDVHAAPVKVKKIQRSKVPIKQTKLKTSAKPIRTRKAIPLVHHTLGFTAPRPGGLSPHSDGPRGHAIPPHLYPARSANAHPLITSVDEIHPNPPTGAHGGQYNAATSRAVPAPANADQLRLNVTGCNLGNDTQGADWDVVGRVEWRIYHQCKFTLQYDHRDHGVTRTFDLIESPGVDVRMEIDYKQGNSNDDDVLSARAVGTFRFDVVADAPNTPGEVLTYKRQLARAVENERISFSIAAVVGPGVSASQIPGVNGYTVPYADARFTWVNRRR